MECLSFQESLLSSTSGSFSISFISAETLSKLKSHELREIENTLDVLGEQSRVAQGLPKVVTSYQLLRNSDHHIYTISQKDLILGFIKVGKKQLFVYNHTNDLLKIRPLCVLDFFVFDGYQRKGLGKIVMDEMLQAEAVSPSKLGYDAPSHKFLSFLSKHYNLSSYVPQNNNFVVFDDYFMDDNPNN